MSAADNLLRLAAAQGPEAVEAVERVRQRTGRHHAAFEWTTATADQRSELTFRACHAESAGGELSVWRFTNPERTGWMVAAISENLGRVQKFRRTCQRYGGVPYDLDADLLEGLRARRFETLTDGLLTEWAKTGRVPTGELHQRARYGGGAVLHPDGTMGPFRRPQG